MDGIWGRSGKLVRTGLRRAVYSAVDGPLQKNHPRADPFFPGIPLTSVDMNTTVKTLLGAGLSLLVTIGSTDTAAAPPAKGPPVLFVAPVKGVQQVLSMNADSTGFKQLTRGTASASSPSRSPDYRYIAFVRNNMIMVMQAIGEPRARIFAVCPSWAGPGIDWSPDGLSIVLCGSSVLANGLWRVPVNPDTGAVGTPEFLRAGNCAGPSWSPDGTKIAFSEMGVVRILDLETSGEISLGCAGAYPSWNAVGDKIAFGGVVCYPTPEGSEAYYEICIANPDGTGWTPVTSLKSFSMFPTWSPDGTQLVFHSRVSGTISLYKTTIGSGTVTLFYPDGNLPNWAP